MQWSDAKPLTGVKVLDLCRVVAGPFATMQLGDLGADILKIEEPGHGDESRTFGPPFCNGESAYFLSINRNKRSCTIDLKSEVGRALLIRLASQADVVIENFRPGTMERLGLGYDVLAKDNPRLVYCAISGFGRIGSQASRPGYDLVIQGEAGIMDITGEADGPPTKVGTSIADLVSGLYAAQAVLAGLSQRSATGAGGRVDVSMIDAMASLLTFNAGIYFATGRSPKRRGNAHPTISPYETFEVSDGWLNVGVANDRFWAAFCPVIGRSDLLSDPRFVKATDRAVHRAELKAILDPIFAAQTRQIWIDALSAAGIPCGAIQTIGEVCDSAHLAERGVTRTYEHPRAGSLRYIASAIRFDDQAPKDATPPPMLGEHTQVALNDWLSLDGEAVAALACEGAFGTEARKAASAAPSLQDALTP